MSLRDFLRLENREKVPDHSWLSKTRGRLPHEVRARKAGLTITAEGGTLVVRGPKSAAPVVRQLADVKAEVLAALVRDEQLRGGAKPLTVTWWRDRFAARIAHWSLNGRRPWQEAERLAFNHMILDWHRLHGARPELGRCAGCGDEIPNDVGFRVDRNGSRVHFDGIRRDDCIIAYGQKWRGAAVAALQALGVNPPAGFESL
jgi:hypothetical protein